MFLRFVLCSVALLSPYFFDGTKVAQAESQDSVSRFRFGVILPLSGPIAEFGKAFQQGIDLARKENPEIDKKIKIVIDDSQYDVASAISILRKYRDRDKVQLVYNWGGNPSGGLAPVAEQIKMPLLVWSADSQLTKGRNYTVRFINPAKDFASLLWTHLQQRGKRNIKIFQTQNAYISAMLQALEETKPAGVKLEIDEAVPFEMTDMRSLVTQLKGRDFDAVGVYLGSGQIESFYKELANQRVGIFTFGTDFFESESQARRAGSAINGAIFANHPVNTEMARRYIAKYGNDVQMPSACLAYDLINFVHSLFSDEHAASLAPDEVLRRIKDTSTSYTGVTGSYAFVGEANGDNFFRFPLAMRVIKNLKPENLE